MTPAEYIANVMPKMEGWCSPEKARKLAEYAHESQTFVEIGVFGGRSLFVGALAQPGRGLAIGIDPWSAPASVAGFTDANAEWWGRLDHDGIYNGCRAMLDRLELNARCHLLRCTSAQALPMIRRLAPIDLAHVDGNHSSESAMFDVENYVPLVKPGGIVFFDDVSWATTKPAQTRLLELADLVEMVSDCGVYRRH